MMMAGPQNMKLSVEEQLVVFCAQMACHGLGLMSERMMVILCEAGLQAVISLWLSE